MVRECSNYEDSWTNLYVPLGISIKVPCLAHLNRGSARMDAKRCQIAVANSGRESDEPLCPNLF